MNALGYARVALGLALISGAVAVAAFYTGEPGSVWACAAVGCVFFALIGWLIVESHRAEQEWLYLERGAMRRLRSPAPFPTAQELVEKWEVSDHA